MDRWNAVVRNQKEKKLKAEIKCYLVKFGVSGLINLSVPSVASQTVRQEGERSRGRNPQRQADGGRVGGGGERNSQDQTDVPWQFSRRSRGGKDGWTDSSRTGQWNYHKSRIFDSIPRRTDERQTRSQKNIGLRGRGGETRGGGGENRGEGRTGGPQRKERRLGRSEQTGDWEGPRWRCFRSPSPRAEPRARASRGAFMSAFGGP